MNNMRRKPDQEYSKALEVPTMHTPETSYTEAAKQVEREAFYARIRYWAVPFFAGCGTAILTAAFIMAMNESTKRDVRAQIVLTNAAEVEARISEIQAQINEARQKELIEIREALNELGEFKEVTGQRMNALETDVFDQLEKMNKDQLEMNKALYSLNVFNESQEARVEGGKYIQRYDHREQGVNF